MPIRDLLMDVASTYDEGQGTGKGVHAQALLREAGAHMTPLLPAGFEAEGYGGSGSASRTPWIGVFDPDITRDPKEGLYLAYIFAADLKSVTLTLQQGVTNLEKKLGQGERRRAYLRARARVLFEGLPEELVKGWEVRPSFKCNVARALSYEAGSVAARAYHTTAMPSESTLREDLWHVSDVLQQAAKIEKALWAEETPEGLKVGYVPKPHGVGEPKGLEGFHPKNGSDYEAHIPERTIYKSRRHEVLVEVFGPHIEQCGFVPITDKMHPKDLVLRRGGEEWLVEVKVIKDGNPTKAVREAVGQLFEYSYFLYEKRGKPKPHLIGLFTEGIDAYADYLEERGIASLWKTPDGWAGSESAVEWGMVG
ncbi:MrcB family domain-containing protein [Streptomyces sp. 8N616]|uniref:MrcB family domain-containing protein n=1 Tax=Streptomyces sp. 8N616 TaxID=3457414 RepID=UPI003FD3A3A9